MINTAFLKNSVCQHSRYCALPSVRGTAYVAFFIFFMCDHPFIVNITKRKKTLETGPGEAMCGGFGYWLLCTCFVVFYYLAACREKSQHRRALESPAGFSAGNM